MLPLRADQCRVRIAVENGPFPQSTMDDAETRFWWSLPRAEGKGATIDDPDQRKRVAREDSQKLHQSFGSELHGALARYIRPLADAENDRAEPSKRTSCFFVVDLPDKWEFSSLTFGVTVVGVDAFLKLFDDDVDLAEALLGSIVPGAFKRAIGLEDDIFGVVVRMDECRGTDRGALAARRGMGGGLVKRNRSLAEFLRQTPVLPWIVAALVVGYFASGSLQEDRRRVAETQARIFDQQKELLASCVAEKHQLGNFCREEKQQVANAHLELIKAYRDHDEACRIAQTAAPRASSPTTMGTSSPPR